MRIAITFLLFSVVSTARCQTIRSGDLKLLIAGLSSNDTTLSPTALLNLHEAVGNFAWINVKEISVINVNRCMGLTGGYTVKCPTNVICPEAKRLLENAKTGDIYFIEATNATNRSGVKLAIQPTRIIVR